MAPTKNRSALFTWHALGTLKWYLLFCCLLPSLCVHVSMTCYKRVSLVFLVHNPNGQYTNLPKSSPKHTKSTKHIGNPASPTTTPLPPPQNRLRTTAAIKVNLDSLCKLTATKFSDEIDAKSSAPPIYIGSHQFQRLKIHTLGKK